MGADDLNLRRYPEARIREEAHGRPNFVSKYPLVVEKRGD
jgi:hypothetical protein